jgi:hypothetical protein
MLLTLPRLMGARSGRDLAVGSSDGEACEEEGLVAVAVQALTGEEALAALEVRALLGATLQRCRNLCFAV